MQYAEYRLFTGRKAAVSRCKLYRMPRIAIWSTGKHKPEEWSNRKLLIARPVEEGHVEAHSGVR